MTETQRLRAVVHHMTLMLDDFGRHDSECVCSGDKTPHSADCKDCECGLREAIEFGVEQSGFPLEPPEATPEESARLMARGIEIVNGLLARYRAERGR